MDVVFRGSAAAISTGSGYYQGLVASVYKVENGIGRADTLVESAEVMFGRQPFYARSGCCYYDACGHSGRCEKKTFHVAKINVIAEIINNEN